MFLLPLFHKLVIAYLNVKKKKCYGWCFSCWFVAFVLLDTSSVISTVGRQRRCFLSLFPCHCLWLTAVSPPGGESDDSEENGGRCGSHRYLRRRRGGIYTGSKSMLTEVRMNALLSVHLWDNVFLLKSKSGVRYAFTEPLMHTGRCSPCWQPTSSATIIGWKCWHSSDVDV